MGYSCAAKASLVLECLGEILLSGKDASCPSNHLPNGGFWEIGREQADGSITGKCWKPWPQDPTRVISGGSFKIDSEGKIVRFPGVPKAIQKQAEVAGATRYQEFFNRKQNTPGVIA